MLLVLPPMFELSRNKLVCFRTERICPEPILRVDRHLLDRFLCQNVPSIRDSFHLDK